MNQEFLYMQKLSGLVNEKEYQTRLEENDPLMQAFKKGLNLLNTAPKKPSPKDGDLEEGLLTIPGLVASVPGMMRILGSTVDGIANVVMTGKRKGNEKFKGTDFGGWIKKKGHDLEHYYINSIGGWLKAAFPKKYGNQDVKDETSGLYDAARAIYISILAAAGIEAGITAFKELGTIIGSVEGGLAGVKTSEIIQLAKEIAKA